jgi:hypothetical protein
MARVRIGSSSTRPGDNGRIADRYTRLDASKIIATAERLRQRITERFPGSGLAAVSSELVSLAGWCEDDARFLARSNQPVRILVAAALAVGIALVVIVASQLQFKISRPDALILVQVLESAMNVAVLVGLGVLALTRLESNWKARRALDSLHRLRSLAHVIDMHQLTKDPSRSNALQPSIEGKGRLSPADLERYLDYCSEMLSLTGKLAALYAQSLQNGVVVDAVNEIEVLTTNLARKIWQKIAIIDRRALDSAP